MKRSIEIELRYQILKDATPLKFRNLFGNPTKKHVFDEYLDTAKGELYRKGVFIRIRNYKNLDFKFNLEDLLKKNFKNDHTHCDEYSFIIPFNQRKQQSFQSVCNILNLHSPTTKFSFQHFKKENNLTSLVTVDKERYTYKHPDYIISVDYLNNLGQFLEIERIVQLPSRNVEVNLERHKQQIKNFASSLGFKLQPNNTGYCELALREQNFDLYQQGKYVLETDKP